LSNKIKNLMTRGRSRIEPETVGQTEMEPEKSEHIDEPTKKPMGKSEKPMARKAPPSDVVPDVVKNNDVVTTVETVNTPQGPKDAENEKPVDVEKPVEDTRLAEIAPAEASSAEKSPEIVAYPQNVPPEVRESIDIVIRLNFSPDILRSLETLAHEHRDFLTALKKLGPDGVIEVSKLADDEDYILTTKIKLLSLINRGSKNEFFHNLMKKVGAAIQAARRLRELLLK